MLRTRLWLVVSATLLLGVGPVHAQVQEEWSHVYAGPGDNDEGARGIAMDALGNCYVAGASTGPADWDFLLGKYNHSGGVEWQIPINGPGDSADYAQTMLVDGVGSCYISGWTTTKGVSSPQKLLVKVNTAGTVLWKHSHKIGGDGSMRHMAFDPLGNIIVVGMSSSSGYHAHVTKYSTDGDSLWARFYRWTGASGGNGQRVACGLDGSVYFTGTATKSTGTFDDILTVKLSADGDTLWGRVYDGAGHNYDEGIDLAVDDDGNAYVVGGAKNAAGNTDIAVLKYNASGTLLWDWLYDGSSSNSDEPVGVRLDPDGNVCIGGSSIEVGKTRDYTFIKLSPSGDSLLITYAGVAGSDYAYDMALDANGNMYITGQRFGVASQDFLTMKFDGATGVRAWEMTWDGNGGYDRGTNICVGEEDYVYVAGYINPTAEPDTKNDIGIVAYEPVAAAVFEPTTNELPHGFILYQNSPNPFNAGTLIRFDLERGGDATLSIVNILGQTILTHRERDLPSGSYSFEWDGTDSRGVPVSSGVYLYRLQTERQAVSRKMVLLK